MKALIAAEIASNWEGSVSKAKKLIKECKNAGADAVKFQMWRALDLYKDNHPEWNIIKKSELTFEKARELKTYSDEVGIEFFCVCKICIHLCMTRVFFAPTTKCKRRFTDWCCNYSIYFIFHC